MTSRLMAPLRAVPATVPALAALVLFVVWATSQAGYPVTHWAPGGLIVLALLAIALSTVRPRVAETPIPVLVALAALAAYTALSYLSITWAAVPGDAWEGANRTLLYLLVFALFAGWRQQGTTAALLLCTWTLALIALAVFATLHIDMAATAQLQTLLPGARLVYPTGYPNANAAQWLMAFWPAVLLARSERLPWGLRGVLAGGAVLLAELALLSQSRGSLYATPVMLVLVFAFIPGRTRTFAVLVPVAAAIGAAVPAVLGVGNHLRGEAVTTTAVHSATGAMLATSVAAGVVVALAAALESRRMLSAASFSRLRIGVRVLAILTLVAVLVGGLAVAGNPVTRVRHGWDSFKGGYGSTGGSRLVSGLGSNRYDFYRVALDEFSAHPLLGIGADNFQQQYLTHGRSDETPHYPHSVELRTLTQTGIVGALLALVGLGGALLAAARALRSPDRLVCTVAGAALAGFAYWLVHGSLDWFWEFAGLGAPAFALLGIACALAPARRRSEAPAVAPTPGRPTAAIARERAATPRRAILVVGGVLAVLLAAVSLGAPWLSQLEIQSAARIWTASPASAYARLRTASRLNPLSDQGYLVAGSIALRYREYALADRDFADALQRTPGDAYASLERGAIASMRGQRAAALALLGRAARLNPRDELTRQALELVRVGHRVNVQELNRLILLRAQQLA
jgi:O-Antigen ligase